MNHATTTDLRTLLVPFIRKRVEPQDVDDVVQTVFLRIQRGIANLREDDKLAAWGYQIARNVIVDHLRQRSVREHEPLDHGPTIVAPTDEPETGASELVAIIGHFIELLPEPYREALELTELRGMTQAHAARHVGITLPGMKSRVQRGRAQLRALLDACCEIELDRRGGIIAVEPVAAPASIPNCCARLHPSQPTSVSRDMTNNNEATQETTTTESAAGCCGGPAPAGANACCVKDAAAKAAGESGCGCSSSPATKTSRAQQPSRCCG